MIYLLQTKIVFEIAYQVGQITISDVNFHIGMLIVN